MHAEIPHDVVDDFNAQVQEGEIYVISRFRITNVKNYFRAVEGRYMIEFTYHTRVAVARDPPHGFPKYVYSLTPFHQLPNLVGNCRNILGLSQNYSMQTMYRALPHYFHYYGPVCFMLP